MFSQQVRDALNYFDGAAICFKNDKQLVFFRWDVLDSIPDHIVHIRPHGRNDRHDIAIKYRTNIRQLLVQL